MLTRAMLPQLIAQAAEDSRSKSKIEADAAKQQQRIAADKALIAQRGAQDLALQKYLYGGVEAVRSQVPDAAFNPLPEGEAGPVAPPSARMTQIYNPGVLGLQKQAEDQQGHQLAEQGARSRAALAEYLAKKYPNYGVNVSKEGASFSPKDIGGPTLPVLTPAQEAAEKAAGKTYGEYEAAGGRANLEKNISQLSEVEKELSSEKDPRDRLDTTAANLPRGLRALITPAEVAREDKVRNAVQASLRQTLGPQFTEKEGEALMSRAWDSRLSTKENLVRVTREANSLRQKQAQMDRSGEALRKTGYATVGVKPEPSKFNGGGPQTEMVGGKGAPVKVERNKKTGQIRTTYADGSVEVK